MVLKKKRYYKAEPWQQLQKQRRMSQTRQIRKEASLNVFFVADAKSKGNVLLIQLMNNDKIDE